MVRAVDFLNCGSTLWLVESMMISKPTLISRQIWNMCFGFLCIQFGFALQKAHVSRTFQTLGAEMDQIPSVRIEAPLTGWIVQPIVGHFSDRTWTRLGRRRPYFLYGAILASLAWLLMPNSPQLWMAAGLLWMLDASFKFSMEPFHAFVRDRLHATRRPRSYAMQQFFIGVGVVADRIRVNCDSPAQRIHARTW